MEKNKERGADCPFAPGLKARFDPRSKTLWGSDRNITSTALGLPVQYPTATRLASWPSGSPSYCWCLSERGRGERRWREREKTDRQTHTHTDGKRENRQRERERDREGEGEKERVVMLLHWSSGVNKMLKTPTAQDLGRSAALASECQLFQQQQLRGQGPIDTQAWC